MTGEGNAEHVCVEPYIVRLIPLEKHDCHRLLPLATRGLRSHGCNIRVTGQVDSLSETGVWELTV